jgi:p-aminobenzoyl-glutamate transporter AbgT
MDHPTTIRLKASIQTLVFVILLAATLFGSAGRFDIIEFWVYIAIVVGASVSSLIILDSDLMQERMQPGGHRVGAAYYCYISALGRGGLRPWAPPSQ